MTSTEPRPVSVALLGGLRHTGPVHLGPRLTHVTAVGGMDLDLTDAVLPAEGVTITKVSLVGGVNLVVPPDVRVEVGGFVLFGGVAVEHDGGAATATRLIRLRAFGLVGGVRVRVG
jgi:hypothetical protein